MNWQGGFGNVRMGNEDTTKPSPGRIVHIRCREWWGDYLACDNLIRWDGYTPAEALKIRQQRFKDAHRNVTRDGLTLHVHSAAPDGSERHEQLDFTEVTN